MFPADWIWEQVYQVLLPLRVRRSWISDRMLVIDDANVQLLSMPAADLTKEEEEMVITLCEERYKEKVVWTMSHSRK